MRKSILLPAIGLLLVATAGPANADEGMWMLHQVGTLDQQALKATGFQLTPEQIWDPKTSSGLASAIVSLGGCSASFVSPDALIATNHHCAFGAIQMNSSPEHDYITEGFLAKDRAAELEAKGNRVYVFRGYDDATDAMRSVLKPGLKPEERSKALEMKEKSLIAECEKDGLRCRVAEMYGGLNYYLFKTLELRDVRLVYAPPRAIGEYGGEVDNWMWPRHTGDFSFLRAYVGPDGKPADYSPANVPYKPERFLQVANAPLKEGDFTMIMGYPGKTVRYRIAAAIADDTELSYPRRIALYKDLIDIQEAQSKRGKDVEIKLASALKGLYNGYKNNQGMLEGLKASDLAGRKRALEAELTAWIKADKGRQAKYGDVLPKMEAILAERRTTAERDLIIGQMTFGRQGSMLGAALTLVRWTGERAKPDMERDNGYQDRDERSLRQRLERMQRNLDLQADRAVLRYVLGRAAALPADQRIAAVDAALKATGATGEAALDALLDTLYARTKLADLKARLAMFDLKHDVLLTQGDSMVNFAAALRKDLKAHEDESKRFDGELVTLTPRFIEALGAFQKTPLYPDANSTLRFTYATVKGYAPRDGVVYTPFTALAGVVAKHTGTEPFDCPQSLRDAAKAGPFPHYADPVVKDVPACFLTTNDITGGNSGSPIMNGKGELIGLAFDGNYESMTSDYQFTDAMSRTINVDSRYMLWVMDYVSKAHGLIREMGLEPQAK
ncbi:MAG: S46 family peptidase [Acidobacteria bacterium]|nr:S46 family peptidase [Acidobacteriota bacterium]